MALASPLAGTRTEDSSPYDGFLPAALESVRRCPAQPECIELSFRTPEGAWNWCFPEPARRRKRNPGPLALTLGPYGVLVRRVLSGGFGAAVDASAVLPMILAGSDVIVARRLVTAGH